MNEKKKKDLVMTAIGLIIVFYSALAYFFGWEPRHPAFAILGLIFLTIGLKRARKR